MSRIVKIFKTIRTNWKKSTCLALAMAYGTNYTIEHFQTHALMRTYCLEAKRHGDQKIPDGINPKSITVILNPTANRRKAIKQFDKYCAPILHLAGICVDVIQTEKEGHARELVEKIKQTDAIIIAGGDGTISEVLTGLFRQTQNDKLIYNCPIGILPLGQSNSVGRVLFPGGETLSTVKSLADASMAIVKENIKLVDVMKIEVIENEINSVNIIESNEKVVEKVENNEKRVNLVEDKLENEEEIKTNETIKVENGGQSENVVEIEETKAIYALSSLEWGAFRDAYSRTDKYWYFGGLRKYATYIFSGYKSNLTWECTANLNYLEPCQGCANCYVPEVKNTRWWSRFFSKPQKIQKDYSKIINERCGEKRSLDVNTTDFILKTTNVTNSDESKLQINLGPQSTNYIDFVKQGFKTLKGENRNFDNVIEARQIDIVPKISDKEGWFSIDKEEFEVKPVRITLLPRVLKIFCKLNDL